MSGYTDLWVEPGTLAEGLGALVWAASEGFTGLVMVCDENTFIQYREAVRAADLGLSVRRGVPTELSGPVSTAEQIWGNDCVFVRLPSRCDLKLVARVLGERARSGFTPVIIGAETSPEVQRQPELLRYLLASGAVLCGMAGSVTGKYGNGCRVAARRIAALGYYHLFAGYAQGQVSVSEVARHLKEVRAGWRNTQSDLCSPLVTRPGLLMREGKDHEGNRGSSR